ncbi:hypothetical protein TD95_001372 [Thielaviopsis punctulata]|uniref:Caffeine-induced death protein Cid2 n=1 Tax=Thielaviopsis punctulata TaxID=72032 RepID=A0A0F4Z762_9PEZI|nr:hypothetical protein TD95_001372 [Thielaviopsis punctulata]
MDPQQPAVSASQLTPQFCFSISTLQDFLRLSRATIDDCIQQRLNSLATPSRHGFDPSSTNQIYAPNSATLDPALCAAFHERVLFPSWRARAEVLEYCAKVAASPDPDDPSAAARAEEMERNKKRVVDERLDPYSGRFFPTEARTERLASVLRLEQGVENIVRMRSWGVVRSKCAGAPFSGQEAYAEWEKKHTKRSR